MNELKQIETMSLRDYIDKEMTRLHQEVLEIGRRNEGCTIEYLESLLDRTCKLEALQEIAYRLEYGFITKIGSKSLKGHLPDSI